MANKCKTCGREIAMPPDYCFCSDPSVEKALSDERAAHLATKAELMDMSHHAATVFDLFMSTNKRARDAEEAAKQADMEIKSLAKLNEIADKARGEHFEARKRAEERLEYATKAEQKAYNESVFQKNRADHAQEEAKVLREALSKVQQDMDSDDEGGSCDHPYVREVLSNTK